MQVGFRSTRPSEHGPQAKGFRALFIVALALAVLVPAAASGATAARPASKAVAGAKSPHFARLLAGQKLDGGSWLSSPNGRYQLVMQTDGNFVLYWEGHALWSSHTAKHRGDFITMQRDGNLVIYRGRRAIWASNTSGGRGAYYLRLQDDGNAGVYTASGRRVWQTNTAVGIGLQLGDTGPAVLALQTYLVSLGYWLGTPDGVFGDSTQQAVYALEKAANLDRAGVVGIPGANALAAGIRPKPRKAKGNLIEVDLEDDLLMVIQNGKLVHTFNTSTGGGYTYTSGGVTSVAITPRGVFHIFATIDGLDVDSLGALWRPRFFDSGFAIHGDSYVPPYPVSHGCVRVSDEAINWIWANNVAPIGEEVWVF
jgi:lipoprotein-anchoring transpeptidase ErfK/SrfK